MSSDSPKPPFLDLVKQIKQTTEELVKSVHWLKELIRDREVPAELIASGTSCCC